MTDKRKIFYLDSDESKPVTAGGVIVYRMVNGRMELLLADTRNNFEDLGGQSDKKDKDIISMVAREANEESNELLNKRKVKNRLKKDTPIYVEKMKYVVYIIEANKEEKNLKSTDFGNKEIHDNVYRKIKWYPIEALTIPEIFKHKLNWRIKNRKIFDKLKEIKESKRISSSMFSSTSDTDSCEKKKKNKKC